jgi:hypothetical protein
VLGPAVWPVRDVLDAVDLLASQAARTAEPTAGTASLSLR